MTELGSAPSHRPGGAQTNDLTGLDHFDFTRARRRRAPTTTADAGSRSARSLRPDRSSQRAPRRLRSRAAGGDLQRGPPWPRHRRPTRRVGPAPGCRPYWPRRGRQRRGSRVRSTSLVFGGPQVSAPEGWPSGAPFPHGARPSASTWATQRCRSPSALAPASAPSFAARVTRAATSADRAEVAQVSPIRCAISRRRVENARRNGLETPSSSAIPRDTSPKRTPRALVRPARRAPWQRKPAVREWW